MHGSMSPSDISASALSAERLRMEVIANNIANANSTRSAEGGPYRRREVVFAAALSDAMGGKEGSNFNGVRVDGVQQDTSELPMVYQPGHPDANQDGFVQMPNVSIANEMVDLITANRSYEGNLRVLRSYRDMVQQSLSLLRAT